jgi:hypothetical protein
MPVFFKCKNCGQEHLCPLFFPDEKSFSLGKFGTNSFSCPVTFKTSTYDKKEMFWIKEEARTNSRWRG